MSVHIIVGDCRAKLREMKSGSFQTCVTSPPYFGLRDYGVNGQIGLEASPDGFVAEMVAVFREVRRVLRDDGTLWLNLGDSYARAPCQASRGGAPSASSTLKGNGHRGGGPKLAALSRVGLSGNKSNPGADIARRPRALALKPKDLIGIPWRVAFALQADGWWLRQDLIWSKPNPMPESVTDRCRKAHEYLFLLSKSERYYYDADAISENGVADHAPGNRTHKAATAYDAGDEKHRTKVGLVAYSEHQRQRRETPPRHAAYPESSDQSGLDDVGRGGRRNKRSVWTVATRPFKEAHFATFPPALIEPCILAGSPKGGSVLDPFGGAGTTGLVADRLGREAVLIELNPEYAEIARRRIQGDAGLFAQIGSAT